MILLKNIGINNKHKQDEEFILLNCIHLPVYMIELYSKYKQVNKENKLIEKTYYNIHYHWWEKQNFNR